MRSRRLAFPALLAALLLGGLLRLGFRLERGTQSAPAEDVLAPAEEVDAAAARAEESPVGLPIAAETPSAAADPRDAPSEGAITGLVVDRYEAPVSGARVKAAGIEARTDHQGEFMLEGVPAGAHALTVSQEGFAALVVSEVEPESNLSITLARLGGVSGQIVDAGTGLGVEDFSVRVLSTAGKTARHERFDGSGGSFALDSLPPGTYVLEAAAQGRASGPVTIEIEDDQIIDGLEIPIGPKNTSKGG